MTREDVTKIAQDFVANNYKGPIEEIGEIERVVLIAEVTDERPKAISENELELYKNEKVTWAISFRRLGEEVPFPKALCIDVDNKTGHASFFQTL